jgi:hypothetical protein
MIGLVLRPACFDEIVSQEVSTIVSLDKTDYDTKSGLKRVHVYTLKHDLDISDLINVKDSTAVDIIYKGRTLIEGISCTLIRVNNKYKDTGIKQQLLIKIADKLYLTQCDDLAYYFDISTTFIPESYFVGDLHLAAREG